MQMAQPAAATSYPSLFFPSKITTTKQLSSCSLWKIQKPNTKSKKLVCANGNPRVRAQADSNTNGDTKVDISSVNGVHEVCNGSDGKYSDQFRGRFMEGLRVFRQNYFIASYQVGAYAKANMSSIISILVDTPLNRQWAAQVSTGEFSATSEMIKKGVTWVAYRMRIVLDCYPLWGDIIEVDNYMCCPPGSNTIRSDCIIRHADTKETLVRASSQLVLMHKKTRKLTKVTQEMRDEVEVYHYQTDPIIDEEIVRLSSFDVKSAQCVRKGITPEWGDIDLNGHVSSASYIDWILQSTPRSVLESHELADVILEFHKECGLDAVVESFTSFVGTNENDTNVNEEDPTKNKEIIELDHFLRLESGPKVTRARTVWRPKLSDSRWSFNITGA